MAAERPVPRTPRLAVRPDQPLIGIVVVEDGQEVTRSFAAESETHAIGSEQTAVDARALAGAWSDLGWKEMVEELAHIRHANTPTPRSTSREALPPRYDPLVVLPPGPTGGDHSRRSSDVRDINEFTH